MLTPSERRGAIVVALLLVLGATYDLWQARPGRQVAWLEPPAAAPPGQDSSGSHAGENGFSSSAPLVPPPSAAPRQAPPGRLVSLNRALAAELETLSGVGPVLAARIVAHREAHGPFRRIEDLLAVRGIGPRLLERLRTHVTIER